MFNYRISLLLLLSIANALSMQVPAPSISTWEAARKGDFDTLQRLITAHPNWVDARERRKKKDNPAETEEGLTPLAWAVLQLNKQIPAETNLAIVNFLVKNGANVNFRDSDGQTILHMAVRGGNIPIIRYLLRNGAQEHINTPTKEKGRTPLAEAVRASKDAIIHLDIEKDVFTSLPQLEKALNDPEKGALAQLKRKESEKLSTNTIIMIIDLLKQNDKNLDLHPLDEAKHPPAYYINEVLLVSKPDLVALLQALEAPETRIIQYDESNLDDASRRLQKLGTGLQKFGLEPQFNNVVLAIQAAQKEQNANKKFNILRVALAFLAHAKEEVKKKLPGSFIPLEKQIDIIRTILRDSALLASGKVPRALLQKPAAPTQPTSEAEIKKPTPVATIKPIETPIPVQAMSPELIQQTKQAIENGQWDQAFNLLQKFVRFPSVIVNATDREGRTPLIEAASRGDVPVIVYLLKSGADINQGMQAGFNPLLEAIFKKHLEVAGVLLRSGANPHVSTEESGNAITLAIDTGDINFIEELLKLGVNPNVPDKTGRLLYPIDIARKRNRQDIVRLLQKYGARQTP
jgi:ankyrin repeat protein